MVPARRIAIGDVLDGKYEIIGVLGEGAMGVVYEANHKRLQRVVALKTVLEDVAQDADLVARFEREARAASAIGHPNIVQVFDAGDDPIPYLVMERLEGESLEDRLMAGPLKVPEAIALVQQALGGLLAAHEGGIIHRDLKPANLFVTKDAAGRETMKILDFGISKILDAAGGGDGRATQAGMIMGTPLYMSPEQTRGQLDIDHRADLWSMACVLYECIAGVPPFPGDNPHQIMAAVIQGEFVSLKDRCPDVSEALSNLLTRALDLDCNKRFRSADELIKALENPANASGGGAEDLSAFDNLADKFLEQEAAESGQYAIPTEVPSVAPTAPTVVLKTPAPDAAPSDRFGPPESSEPLGLALDIDESLATKRRRTSSHDSNVSSTTQRSKADWVTRDEPSGGGGTLLKLVLALAVLVGAGAGYRYFTLGYILPPELPVKTSLLIEAVPAETAFFLDKVKQDTNRASLEGGQQYQVTLRADGYLAMRSTLTPQAGEFLVARAHLAHQLRSLEVIVPDEPAPPPSEVRELTPSQVATGYAKLDVLTDCGSRLAQSLHAALAGNDGEAEAVPYNLVDECRLVVEVNTPKEPPMEPLDGATTALVERIEAYNQALRESQSSAGARGKLRRKLRSAVQEASSAARQSRSSWLSAMNAAESMWMQEESARIKAREGDSLHAEIRALMVASDSWVRAHLAASESAKPLREELRGLHTQLSKKEEKQPEIFKLSGGSLLLRAVAPLASETDVGDPLAHHNGAIALFNQMILPLSLTSKSGS